MDQVLYCRWSLDEGTHRSRHSFMHEKKMEEERQLFPARDMQSVVPTFIQLFTIFWTYYICSLFASDWWNKHTFMSRQGVIDLIFTSSCCVLRTSITPRIWRTSLTQTEFGVNYIIILRWQPRSLSTFCGWWRHCKWHLHQLDWWWVLRSSFLPSMYSFVVSVPQSMYVYVGWGR